MCERFSAPDFLNLAMTASLLLFRHLRGLLCSLCVVVICGCPEQESREQIDLPAVPFEGQSVLLFIPESIDEPDRRNLILDEWSAQSGANCEVRTYDASAGFESFQQLLNSTEGTTAVVISPREWFTSMNQASLLTPIPTSLQGPDELNWLDLYGPFANSTLLWNGNPVALPIREQLLLLYYRADLLEQAERQPPQSWHDYQLLVGQRADWAPGLSIVEPWGASDRTTMFLARSVPQVKTKGNYSVFFNYSTGKPLISTAGFVRGLESALATLPELDPDSVSLTPQDCLERLLEGKAAMAIGPAFFDRESVNLPENISGRIGVAPLPGAREVFDAGRKEWRKPIETTINRVTIVGWDGFHVGVKSDEAGADLVAWNLVRALVVEAGSAVFPPGTMTSTRLSTSQETWLPNVSGLSAREHADAIKLSLRESEVVPIVSILDREQFLESLRAGISSALVGESSAEEALSMITDQWTQLLAGERGEARAGSYAQGLGIRFRE